MSAHRYMLRFYVGPVAVVEVGHAVRSLTSVTEGTEHIWVEWEGEDALAAADSFCTRLREDSGRDFGMKLKESRRVDGRPD